MYDRARAVLARPSDLLEDLRGPPFARGVTAPPVAAAQQGEGGTGDGDVGQSSFLQKVAFFLGLLEVVDSRFVHRQEFGQVLTVTTPSGRPQVSPLDPPRVR